jgi:hypothetical protein
MVRTQQLFSVCENLFVENFGLLILTLILVELCQVVQGHSRVRVIWAKCVFMDLQGPFVESFGLLIDLQSALEERLSLLILTLILVELC